MTPTLMYGTAWKEDATEGLVLAAIAAGFRAIDTANQRKHYYEEGVGRALAKAFSDGVVRRDELFLQSKYTFQRGQDARLPYDPTAPIATQVEQSFRSSLAHLGVEALDSLILHGPTNGSGLVDADQAAWRAMEAIQRAGGTRVIGVSNVGLDQIEALVDFAKVRPAFVQNRCYAEDGWDLEMRAFCKQHDIIYQGFSLLTANRAVVKGPALCAIAKREACTPEQVVFRFARAVGMLPLTGTRDVTHMKQDLAATQPLSAQDVRAIESAGE